MSRSRENWGDSRSERQEQLRALTRRGTDGKTHRLATLSIPLDPKVSRADSHLDSILTEFLERWDRGEHPHAEEYLERLPISDRGEAIELVYQEFCLAEAAGLNPDPADFLRRFPGLGEPLNRLLGLHDDFTCSQLHRLAADGIPLPEVGDEIGPYRLCRELGRGGFARVFLAEQSDLDNRPVVIKISGRITPEPQLLARARHSHIVEVLSHGTIEAGALQLICMPFLGGATLDDVFEERRQGPARRRSGRELLNDLDRVSAPEYPTTGRDRPARDLIAAGSYRMAIAWIIARLAEALDFAYDRGVAHGDIKPSNILLTADGVPMLLDFNLAVGWRFSKAHEEPDYDTGGTLAYMAPERLLAVAEPAQAVVPKAEDRHRADIYALGVVLLEGLTGQTPELGHKRGLSAQQLAARYAESRREPRAVANWSSRSGLDPVLRSILARCLAPDPARRYKRAAELSEDLDRWRNDLPLAHAAEPSVPYRAIRLVRRRRFALAGVLIIAALFGLALVWSNRRVAAQERALAHLANYWDRSDSAVFLVRRHELGKPVGQGNPAETAFGHLKQFEADGAIDWRQRDDFRDLPEPDRSELEAWILEQVLRYCRAVEQRSDGQDEWRRALALVEREVARTPFAPLQTERQRLLHRLQLATESAFPASGRRAPGRAQAWLNEYLRGIEDELDGGSPDGELAHYDAALKARPNSFWAHYRAATVTYRLGQFAVEAIHLQHCINARPQNAMLRVQMAGCLSLLGRYTEALDACDKAIAIDPNQAETFFSRAFIRKQLGQDEGRAADLRRFEVLARRHNKDLSSRLRLDLMQNENQKAGYAANIELARKILEIDPEHIDARVMLADALSHSDKPAEALDELDKILLLNPEHLWARYSRGLLRWQLKRDHSADDFAALIEHPRFKQFLRDTPTAISAYQAVAHFQIIAKDYRAAIATAERGLENTGISRTDKGQLHYMLARAYAAASEKDPSLIPKVHEQLRAAICLTPDYVAERLKGSEELKRFRTEFLPLAQSKASSPSSNP